MDWWYEVAPGTGSTTFKATYSASLTYDNLTVLEISGVNTSTPFDFCTQATLVASTSITSGSFSPAASGDENIFGVRNPGGGASTWTAGTNYAVRQSSTSNVNYAVETRDNAPSGSQTASLTVSPSTELKGMVISLIAAGGGGGGTKPYNMSLQGVQR